MCLRLNISFNDNVKPLFFGTFASDINSFKFSDNERTLIHKIAEILNNLNANHAISIAESEIVRKIKTIRDGYWFLDPSPSTQQTVFKAPIGAHNFLGKMLETAENNSLRPKQGFRYGNDLKRLTVYNRMLAGPMGYKSLQNNLPGCFPSVSTTNRYIHRADHAMVEGELRIDELLVYLKDRNQPMYVALSEDATRVESKVQYDARTNQLVGFVLPIDENNGMPIPFYFKARTAEEILQHFAENPPVSNFINTIMAQPLSGAEPFCLAIFGSNNQYTSHDVANRWNYIATELQENGIGVFSLSSDCDTKYSSAMRMNSKIGHDSKVFSMNGIFKCGDWQIPPFYLQDFHHLAAKLRNLILKTISEPEKLLIGNYYIKQEHFEQLLKTENKGVHHLTASDVNPVDRQNISSVEKICDIKVINLLKEKVEGSDGTVQLLQIMSDVIDAFMDDSLTPLDRIHKMWRSTFLVRIWRHFILKHPKLKLKDNFMSCFSYYCIEQNAHSLVQIIVYLKKNNLNHLFLPHLFSSQTCEAFYRNVRSLTTTNSTVVNFSVKEILNRISRIQLMGEISNDENGFVFPKSLKSSKASTYNIADLPDETEIMDIIEKSKFYAIKVASELGLITKNQKFIDSACLCQIKIHKLPQKKLDKSTHELSESNLEELVLEKTHELETTLFSASLKNFACKFQNETLTETSLYTEIFNGKKRFVFKKCSLCWLFGKEKKKCSSDRRYRVMTRIETEHLKKKK